MEGEGLRPHLVTMVEKNDLGALPLLEEHLALVPAPQRRGLGDSGLGLLHGVVNGAIHLAAIVEMESHGAPVLDLNGVTILAGLALGDLNGLIHLDLHVGSSFDVWMMLGEWQGLAPLPGRMC